MSATRRLFELEVRRALRSPRHRRVAVLLALSSVLSALFGSGLVGLHQRAGARDEAASTTRRAELAKGGRPAGEGAAELPRQSAFELAAWQDTLIARPVSATALFAAGELAALPDAALFRVQEPPRPVPALAERSFATAVLGSFDLAWLLALLLPLAAIGLGFDAIARDRERGTLAMLLGAAQRGRTLLWARATGLFTVLALATLPALLAGALFAPLFTGELLAPLPSLAALLLLLAYDAFLAAAVISASALARRSSGALAALLGVWILFAFAVPIGLSGLARVASPDPDPRARLVGELAAADVYNRPSPAVIATELERDPELAPDKGSDGATSQNRTYLLLARERFRRARGAQAAGERALDDRAAVLELAAWLSPTTMLTSSLAALGGAAPRARRDFLAEAARHQRDVDSFVRASVIANEGPLDDPGRWPSPRAVASGRLKDAIVAAIVYLGLAAALLTSAGFALARGPLAPSRGDA